MSPPLFALLAFIFAQGETGSTSLTGNPIFDALMSFGPIGIVLILAALGYVWFKPGVDQLVEDKKLLQASNNDYADLFRDQVIPLLGEAARSMSTMATSLEAATAHITALQSTVADQAHQIEALQRTVDLKLAARGGSS